MSTNFAATAPADLHFQFDLDIDRFCDCHACTTQKSLRFLKYLQIIQLIIPILWPVCISLLIYQCVLYTGGQLVRDFEVHRQNRNRAKAYLYYMILGFIIYWIIVGMIILGILSITSAKT